LSRPFVQVSQLRKERSVEIGNPRDLEVAHDNYKRVVRGRSPGGSANKSSSREKSSFDGPGNVEGPENNSL